MRELLAKSGHELAALIASGDISSLELSETQARFAAEADATVEAFTCFSEDQPQRSWEISIEDDSPAQFTHLPYAAKDLFCTTNLPTTAGSSVLAGYMAPYDATAVKLLNTQSCHLIGKTRMDEFAMGSSGETCAQGPTRNPWDMRYVPGGSSSGSAAAVAACMVPLALGTDTGGSIRQPASFCGIVGFRPTYGLISRSGMVAYSSSCDQCGTFTRTALDAALAMNTLSQPDPLDSTCVAKPGTDYFAEAQREVHWSKLRVGVIRELADAARIDEPVLANYRKTLDALTAAGAEIVEFDFPLVDYCLPAYYIITAAECSSNLARYDGLRYGPAAQDGDLLERYLSARSGGFGAEVKRRILLGTYVLSAGYFDAYYDRARRLRLDIRRQLDAMFEQVQVILTPTSPSLPFRFGERAEDPVRMYTADLCTVFVNLAGVCGISLPSGFGSDERDGEAVSLPTGVQLVCPAMRDSLLLRIASQFESLNGYAYQPPRWVTQMLSGSGS